MVWVNGAFTWLYEREIFRKKWSEKRGSCSSGWFSTRSSTLLCSSSLSGFAQDNLERWVVWVNGSWTWLYEGEFFWKNWSEKRGSRSSGCCFTRSSTLLCSTSFQDWPKTILVVSHDRQFLNSVATDILHLHTMRLDSYRGNYEAFHRTREERLKNQIKEYEAQKQYRDHIQVGKSSSVQRSYTGRGSSNSTEIVYR